MSIDDATITDRCHDPSTAHCLSRFQQGLNDHGWVTLGQLIARTLCLLMSALSAWSESVGGCVDTRGGCGGCVSLTRAIFVICLARMFVSGALMVVCVMEVCFSCYEY